MTLNEIERKTNHFEGKMLDSYKLRDVNKKILEILKKCIENNIKIELTVKDFIRIVNIYYELYHEYNFKFFKEVINNSTNKIDFYKIMKMSN